MTMSVAELRAASDEELIRLHDRLAESTFAGVNYYLDELARRESRRQTATIRRLTWGVFALTVAIAAMTAASLWAIFQAK